MEYFAVCYSLLFLCIYVCERERVCDTARDQSKLFNNTTALCIKRLTTPASSQFKVFYYSSVFAAYSGSKAVACIDNR